MILPTVRERILEDLNRLTPEMQRRAADLVHRLVATPNQGTPGRDLLRFVGTLDPESARQMEKAIEEGCERVNPDEW